MSNVKSEVSVLKRMSREPMVRLSPTLSLPIELLFLDFESEKFKNATKKFHKLFNVPVDEKLVTCSYSIPFQPLSFSSS